MKNNTIIFYSTPAYGHISPTFEIFRAYVERGYKVYFYSTKSFKSAIEKTGAIFKEYPFDESRLDLTVGSKLLRLEDTILSFANEIMGDLLQEAKWLAPSIIFHDNVALWGRGLGLKLCVPTISINSFPVVPKLFSEAGFAYTKQFGNLLWKDALVIPHLLQEKMKMKKSNPEFSLSMLADILNQEELNIMTFPRHLQPGYRKMKKNYFFLGPSALDIDRYFEDKNKANDIIEDLKAEFTRTKPTKNELANSKNITNNKKLIFISLGTIFQNNLKLYETIIRQFGNTKYQLLISMNEANKKRILRRLVLPQNISIETFVPQCKVLDQASLFICAGGMNSLCQAVHRKVPCLIYPQQGEQRITSERICKLGLGKMLKNLGNIYEESESAIRDYKPDERIYSFFDEPDYDYFIRRINVYCKGKF